MFAVFFAALLFGFAFCLSPGAVLAETLRRGLNHGFRPALLVQFGSLIGDALWALIGLTGLALLLSHETVRVPLTLACAAYLAWLGWQSLGDALRPTQPLDAQPQQAGRGAFFAGAAISLSNPERSGVLGRPGQCVGGDRRRRANSGAGAGVLRRLHAGVTALLFHQRGAGGVAAAGGSACVAPGQPRGVRRAAVRPRRAGAARALTRRCTCAPMCSP